MMRNIKFADLFSGIGGFRISYEPALGPLDLAAAGVTDGAVKCSAVIAGGESGPKARPADPDWFRSVRDQCAEHGIPYFFKQWGNHAPENGVMVRMSKDDAWRMLDGRTHDDLPWTVATREKA